jgi:hypothetical protein
MDYGLSGGCEMLDSFRVARYRFTLDCLSPIEFRTFAGSTLRGAFGSVFRRLVCITRAPTCEGCLLRHQCAYGYVFETAPAPDSQRLRHYDTVPRPYVFDAPAGDSLAVAEAEQLEFGLTLIGRAVDYFPYFVFTAQKLEESGLGAARQEGKGRFRLTQVEAQRADGQWVSVFRADKGLDMLRVPLIMGKDLVARAQGLSPHRLQIHFLSPTRLRFEGKLTDEVEFHHLVRAMLHRLSGLVYFHCSAEPSWDFSGLITLAQQIRTVQRRIQWVEQERYSRRQRRRLPMGGFMGEMTVEGNLEPFLPLLVAAEYVHLGKGTVMGLGKIRIVSEEGSEHD